MHVYLDDNPYAVTNLPDKTLRQVAQEVREALGPQGRMLVGLFTDGQLVPPERIDATLDSPAERFERIDFQSAVPQILAREVLTQARALVSEATPLCEQAGELLSAGQTARAMEMLGNCLGVWSQVQESMVKSVDMLGLDLTQVAVEGRSAEEMLNGFAEQLRAVKEALENRDYVQLSDILQYELHDVAPRWEALLDRLLELIKGNGPEVT